jgi:molybdopterin molybdotransferase
MSEPDVSQLLTVQQAIEILDAAAVSPHEIRLPLGDALGHYLAEDLAADRDYPPFDKSLMDGYAVRAADLTAMPATLRVIGEVPAGQTAARPLQPGEAYAIMTGAPIPPGADGAVPVEDTRREGEIVHILRAPGPQRFITRKAADIAQGRVVLARGARLEAAQLAAAATVGADHVNVYAQPKAAVLATGDEIVPVDAVPGPAQIRNSNTPMLLALLSRMGCQTLDLRHAPDRPEALGAKLRQGLDIADVLFVTGGMSMGTYDYVPKLLADMGIKLHITKLRIKPGKPFIFGTTPDVGLASASATHPKYVFGLPGNPVSSCVCTVRLASRLITRMAGGAVREKWIAAHLTQPLPANGPREFYQPVRLQWDDDRAQTIAHPLEWKGSADLFTLAQADGLLVRPENDVPQAAAAPVRVLEI